jgi:GNAT superfamily N-acetyltransferase
LVVASSARRKGVGRQLLEAAVKEARVFAAKQVDVRLQGGDAGAKAFLARCGFDLLDDAVYRLKG